MERAQIKANDSHGRPVALPLTWVHTLVIGSGAAGLNAALQLHRNGIEDLLIVTEGLEKGTSINTGSDKQTYYKLSLCGRDADSPRELADMYFNNGSMHGDLALVEASLSPRAFLNLVNLGVPFPRDPYGQFIGYKTDHDPRQRATSIGPYTSREMCRALIREVKRLQIPIHENTDVAELLTVPAEPSRGGAAGRVAGAVAVGPDNALEVFGAENVVFAVGGPGGLYRASVYPNVHTGAIGLALMAGARAQSLPESQYGLASTQFRWNVSGTYMQVVPRFISTAADGKTDEREFMRSYFDSVGQMCSNVFLKGYQWPFDSRKAIGGSSIVDILVYIETVLNGRRAFLDFRANPDGFRLEDLSAEAREYLAKSNALQATPLARLQTMNPGAIELYRDHGIDITREPLEIAVCAQHNNGGIAANHWWESLNLKHLFPVGEVNGSHGVYRPGGSALNSGQVAGFRAAEYIANRYAGWTVPREAVAAAAVATAGGLLAWLERCAGAPTTWQAERQNLQDRMSRAGAHIRSLEELPRATAEAWEQWRRIEAQACRGAGPEAVRESLRNRQLCFAHAVYLDAIRFAMEAGVGSRGSAIAIDKAGTRIHPRLDDSWRIAPEDPAFRDKVLETDPRRDGKTFSQWIPRRPIPESDLWFETAWARFRKGEIYG
jgi:succinate dehydrogenase/fumarate reductase flavoprotein subunit